MSKAKMKSYSIDEKIKILKCLDQPGMDRKAVREKYGLSESTLRGFIKNKAQLIEKFKISSVESVQRKRNREGAFPLPISFPLMEGQKNVSLLDAIHLAAESWDLVTETTIKTCFKHGGFAPKNDEELNPLHDVDIPVDMAPNDFSQ